MKINGPAERKRPNQPPEHAREITIQKAGARNYASLRSAVMALLAIWRKAARKGFVPVRVSPTLNVVHAGSTRCAVVIDRSA